MRYKLFLSSPSDVTPEREAAIRVVNRVNGDLSDESGFDLYRWEDDYYTADASFQDQIVKSSDCDLVVCIFWKRLGSPLPPEFMRADGTLPTGTEYEFELALQKAMSSNPKVPDILAYRKKEKVLFDEDRVEAQMQQRALVLSFWNKWFKNEQGHFVAGYNNFEDTADFEAQFEKHLRAWLDDRETTVSWTRGSPFRGLARFEPEHAPIYFGRTREVERARARILANIAKERPFLLITGPSGSGKSSLVRAGLLPRLMRSGGAEGIPLLDLAAMTSPALLLEAGAGDWAHGLAAVLFGVDRLAPALRAGDFDTPESLGAFLALSGPDAAAPVRRALERVGKGQGLILVLDQLEELFAWESASAEGFGSLVETLCANAPVAVIATIRSEFQHRLGEIPALERLCGLRAVAGPEAPVTMLEIGLPRPADLREMILKPAAAAGLSYEGPSGALPDLAERIEAESGPGTLPAMQMLLAQLYERREGEMMTHAAHDAFGGVQGVMARRADAVLAEQSRAVRDALPRLARVLIQSDASGTVVTSRRMPLDRFATGSPERKLAAVLQEAGLLISEGASLRLAHESLVEGWGALRAVVLEERKNLAILNRVAALHAGNRAAAGEAAVQDWLTGPLLAQAQALKAAWGADTLDAVEPGLALFIARSARRRRRRRALLAGSGVVAAGMVLFAYLGFVQLDATRELAERLSKAEGHLRAAEWTQAVAAAGAALDLADTAETRSVALTALVEAGSGHLVRQTPPGIASAIVADKGAVLAIGGDGSLHDALSGARLPAMRFPGEETSGTVGSRYNRLWSLSDGTLVVLRTHGEVEVLTAGAARAEVIETAPRRIYPARPEQADLAETARGFVMATVDAGNPGRLLTCNRQSGSVACREDALPEGIDALAIASDGRSIVVATRAGLSLHPIDDPAAARPLTAPDARVRSLTWMMRGERPVLIAGLENGAVAMLDTPRTADAGSWHTVPAIGAIADGVKPVIRIVADPSGRQLAYDCAAERICVAVLGAEGPVVQTVLYRTPAALRDMAWTTQGDRLVSLMWDGSVSVWSLEPASRAIALALPAAARISALATDPARGRIWIGDTSGTITRVDADGRLRFGGTGWEEVKHLAVASNGALAAALSSQAVVRIWADGLVEPEKTEGLVERVAWLGDGETLVAPVGDKLRSWPEVSPALAAPASQSDTTGGTSTLGGVVALPDGKGILVSTSYGGLYRVAPHETAPLVPLEVSADTHSALGLHISPDGRHLAATREDDRVLIYDIAAGAVALELTVPQSGPTAVGTKVARFSPDGTQLAVLTASGRVHVWRLAHDLATAEVAFAITPAPHFTGAANPGTAVWLDWVDAGRIAVAHAQLGIVVLDTRPEALHDQIAASLAALAPVLDMALEDR